MAVAATLAGCATAPPQQTAPQITLPEDWSSTPADNTPGTFWLDDFNEPELNNLVAEALENNASLRASTARFAQILAENGLSRAERLPVAGIGLDTTRQKINSIGPQFIDSAHFNNYQLGLNISWEIDLWGKLRNRNSAALARTQAGAAELLQARQSLAAQIAKAWFDHTQAQAQWQLATETARTDQQNLQAIETRFQRGLTDGLDLHRIRTQAATSAAKIQSARRALDAAARWLQTLLGRYPDAGIQSSGKLPGLPATIPAGLPAQLLQRRPDLIAAERQLAAADKTFSASRKDRLPAISLTAAGGTRSDEFNDLLDSDFSIWSIAGNLTQPLFQGGRIRANIDRSRALRDQAQALYRDTALRAFREVETALANENYLRQEYEKLSIAAEQADAAESLAWNRYRDGTTSFNNALETQRTANNIRQSLIALRNRILQNRIDLYLALGGPFTESSS